MAYFLASFILDWLFPSHRRPFIHVKFTTFNESQQQQRSYAPPPPPRPDAREEAFRTLGLPPTATPDEVRQAFRRLARENHPDRFATATDEVRQQAEARFKRITEARDLILGK